MLVKKALHLKGLSKTEKLVLLAITDHADTNGLNSWPSYNTISDIACCSRSTAQEAVKSLESKGLLKKKRRAKEGKSISNLYSITLNGYTGDRVARQSGGGIPTVGNEHTHEHIQNKYIGAEEVDEEMNKRKTKPTTPIAEDWYPDEKLMAWASERLRGPVPVELIESFVDHYLANGEYRADWNASFRTWVRNDLRWKLEKRRASNGSNQQGSKELTLNEWCDNNLKRIYGDGN